MIPDDNEANNWSKTMTCKTCDNKMDACNLAVTKITGAGVATDPADYRQVATSTTTGLPQLPDVPGGGSLPPVPGGAGVDCGGYSTSNCMFGPPSETLCQRAKRQLKYQNSVETASAEIDSIAPLHIVTTPLVLGFSPYGDPTGDLDTPVRFIVTVPSHDLTSCDFVCEFRVTVTNGNVTRYTGPAGMVEGRSSYFATQNNTADPVSQPMGQKFGSRILTYDGHCACDCIKLWHTFDLDGQIEFTLPAGALGNIGFTEDDIVTVEYQVTRVYVASKACVFPERCGEDDLLAPYAGEEP